MTSPSVIGRGMELAPIERFLSLAAGGLVALLVEGPAGIGKTTLWEAGRRGGARLHRPLCAAGPGRIGPRIRRPRRSVRRGLGGHDRRAPRPHSGGPWTSHCCAQIRPGRRPDREGLTSGGVELRAWVHGHGLWLILTDVKKGRSEAKTVMAIAKGAASKL